MSYSQLRELAAHVQTDADPRSEPGASGVEIGLNAAIVAVADNEPVVLIIRNDAEVAGATDGLPFGPFSPVQHRTFEGGLRAWVHRQTGLELGYAEQLYTFGDRGRHAEPGDVGPHVVSIGYLALTQAKPSLDVQHGAWRSWYQYFPWEDWRRGRPEILESHDRAAPARMDRCAAHRRQWRAGQPAGSRAHLLRARRRRLGRREGSRALRAALRGRTCRRGGARWPRRRQATGPSARASGVPMRFDHRRILATAIGRVRAKIKYRPVIFELMPDDFTLFELQRTVEAILGPHLHKQNFRRLVEGAGLVETTGEVKMRTGGRPAKLYRFRREVLLERPGSGRARKARQGLSLILAPLSPCVQLASADGTNSLQSGPTPIWPPGARWSNLSPTLGVLKMSII